MQVGVEEPGNVAKYRHFDFDTSFDTDTPAKIPVFGGGDGGASKTNVFDTSWPLPSS
jgi:hypothetical protein